MCLRRLAARAEAPTARRLRVLIVDDEPSIRYAVADFLQVKGYATETAANAGHAVREITTGRFDLAVVDLHLCGATASADLSLVQRIAAQAPETPVLVLTGYGCPETEAVVRRLGAAGYLTKPCSLETLAARVATVLDAGTDLPAGRPPNRRMR